MKKIKLTNSSLKILILFFIAIPARAEFHLLETKEVYLDYMHYIDSRQPFLAPSYAATNDFDLHLNLELFNGYGFVDNMIHSSTDATQFRLVGWNYRAGVHIGPYADVYFEHYSQHLLDYTPASPNVYDGVGVRIYFYRKKIDFQR